jgi:DNA invertase Pin-like site-specific DNA recombinase
VVVKAFAYLRVSGRAQVEGDGFDRQILACEKYAADNAFEIAEVFREEAISGTKELDDRPALASLLAALEENGIKTILIEKLDRLARDLMVQETIIADLRKRGFTLISVYEPDLCSDDPSRKLMRQIMGAIAEYDRVMIVQKLRAARGRKKLKHGKAEGRHAFGEKPSEASTLEQIREWRGTGATPKKIAEDLNACGYKSRSGLPWRGTTVAKIIRRMEAV